MNSSRRDSYQEIIESAEESEQKPLSSFIKAENVVKDFDLDKYIMRAVDGVSFNVAKHEYIAIIGASGAGKTTLLHIFAGLVKHTNGVVHIAHIDISPMSEETLSTFRIFTVGMVFQNYNLISSLTALENVMFPLQLCGFKPEEAEARAVELLEKIGLKERANHLPVQLSAGEQQRVAIARALANDPPIIIADEPTANLDKQNAQFIGTMFENLRQEGKTIIVATHDDNLIQHAHRVLVMEEGKIIEDTLIKEVSFADSELPSVTDPDLIENN